MLKNPLPVNMNNEGLALSFIWKDRSSQSVDYILISIVLNPLERHHRSAEILVSVSMGKTAIIRNKFISRNSTETARLKARCNIAQVHEM